MSQGIYKHRNADGSFDFAWVLHDEANGVRVSEQEYRQAGYLPEFDQLPVRIVQSVPVTHHGIEEVDRVYLEARFGKENA